MDWFSEHLLNLTHWIYIRLLEDAPRDRIHQHLTRIFDIGVMDTVNWRLGDEIDFSACPGDWSVDKVTSAPYGVLFFCYGVFVGWTLSMTKTAFTFEELEAITELIQFHDDWEDLSERLEVNIETLFGKVCDLQTELNEGA